MKIIIHNGDLENVHIDTYQMLSGESFTDMEIDNLREEYGDDITYDSFDWTYDHESIVRDFAHASINYLYNELVTHGDGLITGITYQKSGSPKFYNYSSDWYTAEYDVNPQKLHDYIATHYDEILEKVKKYHRVICDGDITSEDHAHAGLCHYIDNHINSLSDDDYNYHMWEVETEVYYENTTMELIKKS